MYLGLKKPKATPGPPRPHCLARSRLIKEYRNTQHRKPNIAGTTHFRKPVCT